MKRSTTTTIEVTTLAPVTTTTTTTKAEAPLTPPMKRSTTTTALLAMALPDSQQLTSAGLEGVSGLLPKLQPTDRRVRLALRYRRVPSDSTADTGSKVAE